VILDRGTDASIVLVRSHGPLEVGATFSCGNRTWVVTRQRNHLRGFVARPLSR
jgi:hypothetical protein